MFVVEKLWDRRQLGREKLQSALRSAIDILIEKLENFMEMVFKQPLSHMLHWHTLRLHSPFVLKDYSLAVYEPVPKRNCRWVRT